MLPGYDFTREIELTEQLALGDTVLLRDATARSPASRSVTRRRSSRGASREELRVLKLVLARRSAIADADDAQAGDFARRSGTRRVAMRVQGEYSGPITRADRAGRARAVDRPADVARGVRGGAPGPGVVLSNWEI